MPTESDFDSPRWKDYILVTVSRADSSLLQQFESHPGSRRGTFGRFNVNPVAPDAARVDTTTVDLQSSRLVGAFSHRARQPLTAKCFAIPTLATLSNIVDQRLNIRDHQRSIRRVCYMDDRVWLNRDRQARFKRKRENVKMTCNPLTHT